MFSSKLRGAEEPEGSLVSISESMLVAETPKERLPDVEKKKAEAMMPKREELMESFIVVNAKMDVLVLKLEREKL